MSEPFILGIDWGGTRVKLGAVAHDGTLLRGTVFDSPRNAAIKSVVDALLERAAAFLAEAGGGELCGIGLALTGPVDPERGVAHLPGKVEGLAGFHLVPEFRARFGVPAFATNDGLAALYAEKHLGHARGCRYAVAVTIGTGVGSGVMVDGRIPNDPNFLFGMQLGHLVIDLSDDRLCLTGARGTGEMNCSATALALAVRSGIQRGVPCALASRYWENPHAVDFRAVITEGVEAGDALCLDELARWSRRLGWMLVNAVHAYSPEVIILSGGATLAAAHFLPGVSAFVQAHSFRYPPAREIPIVVSALAEHAGVLGAAMMLKERLP